MIEVIPALLEKDPEEIQKKLSRIEGLVQWVQIDLADGVLVPNTVLHDPFVFSKISTTCHLELHLMVKDPVSFIKPFVDVGFRRLYAHVESGEAEAFISACYAYDVEVGLAIDGPTPIEKIRPYIDNIDAVLVMSIEAGFSGKPYREDTADRIQIIHDWSLDLPIAVDGAMNLENAKKVIQVGATRICTNSYLFNAPNIQEAIHAMEQISVNQ